ncbi:MAG: DUF3047 domain-containing protein [Nitrospirota bacterium]
MHLLASIWMMAVLISAFPASADDRQVLFREDFANLDSWKPFTFPKIKSHSTYTIERTGNEHILRAESSASASAIVYKDSFSVSDFPRVKWRWKVKNLYAKGDVRTKEGDDYPIRVYIMFEYDPDKAGFGESIKYGFAKSLYGEYPPHSSLSYIWSSKDDPEKFVVSPYTDKAVMVLLEKGPAKVGTWVDEEIDILADYQKAFKVKPPARARIAIMNDSDNTGESAVSYVEYIEVFK